MSLVIFGSRQAVVLCRDASMHAHRSLTRGCSSWRFAPGRFAHGRLARIAPAWSFRSQPCRRPSQSYHMCSAACCFCVLALVIFPGRRYTAISTMKPQKASKKYSNRVLLIPFAALFGRIQEGAVGRPAGSRGQSEVADFDRGACRHRGERPCPM